MQGDGTVLSAKQREIVKLVAQGYKNVEIAGMIETTETDVRNQLFSIFDKLGVSDRLELVLHAVFYKMLAQPEVVNV